MTSVAPKKVHQGFLVRVVRPRWLVESAVEENHVGKAGSFPLSPYALKHAPRTTEGNLWELAVGPQGYNSFCLAPWYPPSRMRLSALFPPGSGVAW